MTSSASLPFPGFIGVDHVAIAVAPGDLTRQTEIYRALGFREVHREDVGRSDQVREVLLQMGEEPALIQLLEPLGPESPVARQLLKNGGRGGIAHVAYRVTNIDEAFAAMQALGLTIIDAAPRPGSRGTSVFFVHPKSLGYLIEVVAEGPSHE